MIPSIPSWIGTYHGRARMQDQKVPSMVRGYMQPRIGCKSKLESPSRRSSLKFESNHTRSQVSNKIYIYICFHHFNMVNNWWQDVASTTRPVPRFDPPKCSTGCGRRWPGQFGLEWGQSSFPCPCLFLSACHHASWRGSGVMTSIDIVDSAWPRTRHQSGLSLKAETGNNSLSITGNNTLKPSTSCSKCKAYAQLHHGNPSSACHCSIWVRHRRYCLHLLLRFCPANILFGVGNIGQPLCHLYIWCSSHHFAPAASLSQPFTIFLCRKTWKRTS